MGVKILFGANSYLQIASYVLFYIQHAKVNAQEEVAMVQQKLIDLINLVERAANVRNEMPVSRWCIEEALQRINDGLEEIWRYPSGSPSLRGVYDIAVKLESAAATKN